MTMTLLRSMPDMHVFSHCAIFCVIIGANLCAIFLACQAIAKELRNESAKGAEATTGGGNRRRDPPRRLSAGRMAATDRSGGSVRCETVRGAQRADPARRQRDGVPCRKSRLPGRAAGPECGS